jgi:hypothetical protein
MVLWYACVEYAEFLDDPAPFVREKWICDVESLGEFPEDNLGVKAYGKYLDTVEF